MLNFRLVFPFAQKGLNFFMWSLIYPEHISLYFFQILTCALRKTRPNYWTSERGKTGPIEHKKKNTEQCSFINKLKTTSKIQALLSKQKINLARIQHKTAMNMLSSLQLLPLDIQVHTVCGQEQVQVLLLVHNTST